VGLLHRRRRGHQRRWPPPSNHHEWQRLPPPLLVLGLCFSRSNIKGFFSNSLHGAIPATEERNTPILLFPISFEPNPLVILISIFG